MIFELNVRYSVRCSSCGKKLDCAADTNSAENYDVVLVVEPHGHTPVTQTVGQTLEGVSMNAIEEALQENIIETHDGTGDYCAFCRLVIEDNKGHSATCPRALALVEYQKLVTALQWYLHDDETSVEMGILESVDKRPAYIALREVCPTPRAADECPTCAGLGFVNDNRGRRGVDCSDCNGSGIRH